ncbi:MAG: type II toxin-antitoxin system VapC family toxin [Pyrinomonadaceae bacterium]
MVIVDANLLVALVSGDPRGAQVQQQFLQWLGDSVDLHAPALARYEVANALTRLIVAKAFPADKVEEAWANLSVLPIAYHPSIDAKRVVEIALRLGGKMPMTRRILLWQNL